MAKRSRCPPNATRGVDGAYSVVSNAMARVSGLARPLDDSLARLAALEVRALSKKLAWMGTSHAYSYLQVGSSGRQRTAFHRGISGKLPPC